MAETQLRSGVYNYEISTVYPTSQVLLKWYSQFNLLCLTHVLSLFSLCLAPKGPLGEVTQKQMITEWYEHEMLKLSSRDEIEQQMSNTFFLWEYSIRKILHTTPSFFNQAKPQSIFSFSYKKAYLLCVCWM